MALEGLRGRKGLLFLIPECCLWCLSPGVFFSLRTFVLPCWCWVPNVMQSPLPLTLRGNLCLFAPQRNVYCLPSLGTRFVLDNAVNFSMLWASPTLSYWVFWNPVLGRHTPFQVCPSCVPPSVLQFSSEFQWHVYNCSNEWFGPWLIHLISHRSLIFLQRQWLSWLIYNFFEFLYSFGI